MAACSSAIAEPITRRSDTRSKSSIAGVQKKSRNCWRFKVLGLYRTGSAHIQQGDIECGLLYCDEALALEPIPYDVAMAKVFRGYGQIKAGRLDAGIAELREAIDWLD